MLFLAECRVRKTDYGNDPVNYTELQLVEADDEGAAVDKIKKFYDDMNDEYSVSYWVDIAWIRAPIT